LEKPELASALASKTIFEREEWSGFGICDLRHDDFIKVDKDYFKPAVAQRKVAATQRAQVLNPGEPSRRYSSTKNNDTPGNGYACSCLDSPQAWSPASNTDDAWMEIDLGEAKSVAGVVTQGCAVDSVLEHQYVSEIAVELHSGSPGRKWDAVGSERPQQGAEIQNEALSEALQTRAEFTDEDLSNFKVPALAYDSFINVGGTYYSPAQDQAWAASSPAVFTMCEGGNGKAEHVFDAPCTARYVRIRAKKWHRGIAMRAGGRARKTEPNQRGHCRPLGEHEVPGGL